MTNRDNAQKGPGFSPKWESSWKRTRKDYEDVMQSSELATLQEMEYYSLRGETMGIRDVRHQAAAQNPSPPWENGFVTTLFSRFSSYRYKDLEIQGVDAGVFDVATAQAVFSASYTFEMVHLYTHHQFVLRSGGRALQSMQRDGIYTSALGIVSGCDDYPWILARLQLTAYRKGYYRALGDSPSALAILCIMAAYLGEPALADVSSDFVLAELLSVWRNENPDDIVAACLTACDSHSWPSPERSWTRTPIAVLLVLKLRALRGLRNPHIDHPMMNTALGSLPAEAPFKAAPEVCQLRGRLAQQGYDERSIFDMVYEGADKARILAAFPSSQFVPQTLKQCTRAPVKKVRRLGLHAGWLANWDSVRSLFEAGRADRESKNRKALQNYADQAAGPQHERWLDTELIVYANASLLGIEVASIGGAPMDLMAGHAAFGAAYLEQVLALAKHRQDAQGKNCGKLGYKMVPFVALGVVLGRPEALQLAAALIHARRLGYYTPGGGCPYPIFNFILRLLTDYLGKGPMFVEADRSPERMFNTLFDQWRSPVAQDLRPLCMEVCDYHTHRCAGGGEENSDVEFNTGKWTRFPIEVLLLFKLRRLLGLDNPVLDHPLMNTSLGQLPDETVPEVDSLLLAVRAQMKRGGLDENELLAFLCA